MFLKYVSVIALSTIISMPVTAFAESEKPAEAPVATTNATFSPTSIAIIDLERVISASSAGKDLDAKVKAKKNELKTLAEGYQKSLKAKEQALIKVGKSMNPKDEVDRKEWEKKKKDFDAEILNKRKDIDKKNTAIVKAEIAAIKEIQTNVVKFAAEIADAKKIQVVLDRKAVLIAIQGLDITDDVLKQLNDKVKTVPFKAAE